jgi:hypothetical protein
MMEKSSLAGEGGGAGPLPFTIFTITYKGAVYTPAERADTIPLFHLHPLYLLCDDDDQKPFILCTFSWRIACAPPEPLINYVNLRQGSMGGKSAYLPGESIQQRAGFCTDDIFLTNHI